MHYRFAELAIELGGFAPVQEDLSMGAAAQSWAMSLGSGSRDARIACASYRARGEYVPKRDVAREQELLLLGNGLRHFSVEYCGKYLPKAVLRMTVVEPCSRDLGEGIVPSMSTRLSASNTGSISWMICASFGACAAFFGGGEPIFRASLLRCACLHNREHLGNQAVCSSIEYCSLCSRERQISRAQLRRAREAC